MTSLADHLRRSPAAYPHSWETGPDAVFFVGMDEATFQSASFLDQRILPAGVKGESIPAPP